jgi:hypothetical protein
MMVVPHIVRQQPGAGGLNRRDGHEGFRGIEGFGGEKMEMMRSLKREFCAEF